MKSWVPELAFHCVGEKTETITVRLVSHASSGSVMQTFLAGVCCYWVGHFLGRLPSGSASRSGREVEGGEGWRLRGFARGPGGPSGDAHVVLAVTPGRDASLVTSASFMALHTGLGCKAPASR